MKRILFVGIMLAIFCQASFAAKILLKDNNQFPSGDVVGIQDHVVVVKTEFGNLTAEFSKIDTILFDEKANPTKPGIQFKNGDVITGELDLLKDNVLTIKMKYGLYLINDITAVASANFIKNTDQFDYSQESALYGLFFLNKYEHIYGDLLTIENDLMVINSRYGTLNIKLEEAEKIQFAELPKSPNVKTSMIIFKNGDRIQGKPTSLKNGELHIQTAFGEMIITKTNVLANVILGENQKTTNTTAGNIPNYSQDEEISFNPTQHKEWDVVPELGKGNIIVKAPKSLALTSSSDTPADIIFEGFAFELPVEIFIKADFTEFTQDIIVSDDEQTSIAIKFEGDYIFLGDTKKYYSDVAWKGDTELNDIKILLSDNVERVFINDKFIGTLEIPCNTLTKLMITKMDRNDYLYFVSIKPVER